MKTPNTIDRTWNGSRCLATDACEGAGMVEQRGVGRGRRDVLLSIGRMKGMRGVVSFLVVVGLVGVGVGVCVSVVVIDSVVVDMSVMVAVLVMNEVSKIDSVTSTVSVM